MGRVYFFIDGQEVTGLTAERQFVEWVLSLAQEHDKELARACDGDRSALNAIWIFQKGAFRGCEKSRSLISKCGVSLVVGEEVAA